MKRADLLKDRKVKILIEGNSGSGKTYTAIHSLKYIKAPILYIDIDDGASFELLTLSDEELEHFELVRATTYDELMNILNDIPNNVYTVVIDLLHPLIRDMCRTHVKNQLLKVGYYYHGEKKIYIEDKNTFDLKGFLYGIANNREKDILWKLRKLPQNIVCLSHPLEDKDRNMVRGFFDICLTTTLSTEGYVAKVNKSRGGKSNGKIIKNHIELVAKVIK